jgi:hypothetical protein
MTDLERRAPRWAAMAILALGIWGMLIAEPYWRAVGHGPTAFMWTSWAAMLLSAPASVLARPAARLLSTDIEREIELVFVLEHILWAVLIVLQWLVLRRVAARLRPARQWTLLAAALSAIGLVAGVVSWMERWPLVHGEDISWNVLDRSIAIFGLALVPPAWLLLQRRYHRSSAIAETSRRGRIPWLSAAAAAGLLLILCWFAVWSARPGSWLFALEYRDEFRRSEIATEAIEAFRRAHGRLPDSLQEAGLPLEQFDERCPCYEKQTEQSYIVSFGWTLGESVVYDSVAGEWQY